ncbi:MAG: GNAT family N-acetyltransferase [Pararhodobacter sp.]|nr:GNAT family N-acetyltransferase [Pararhodobacter sp.]
MNEKISVRPVALADREAWERLYRGYAAFYKVEQSAQMRERVWNWLHDPAHECEGLVAEGPGGALLGMTHFRPYARPLAAATGCFLDDLFVAPDARGTGAAEALIEAVRQIAGARGWTLVRWITAEDNYRARGLYDRVASRTNWVTYDIKL